MRLGVIAAALFAVLALAPTALANSQAPKRLPLVSADRLRHDVSPLARHFRDRVLTKPLPLGRWQAFDTAGDYTTPDGYRIHVSVTNSYVFDPNYNQSLVNFFSTILHGSELGQLTIFVRTPAEMQQACGGEAAACYSPSQNTMIIAGETVGGIPPEEVITHEYGHHISNHRNNLPFNAEDYGPKYWATVVNVCSLTRRGLLFPGDEGRNYTRNPGEGWAENYRAWNEQHLGWTSIGWIVVDPYFIPDGTRLAAVEADVTRPWAGPTVAKVSGRLKRKQVRVYGISPFDGTMSAQVTGQARVAFVSSKGKILAGPARSIRYLVCGDVRPIRIAVIGLRLTRFALRVAYADLA